jgi:signal-transduction protein with cAMP-binding, CBS, and nucleotidyltransferase domain
MDVARIYTRNVIATQRSHSLQQAAALMRQHHIGALLVTEDEPHGDRAIGMVTDRDFVIQAMAEGISPQEITVGEVMTPEIAGVAESADVHQAMETMRQLGVRRLAVTGGDGEVVGVLSFDDVIDALSVEMSSLAKVIRSERDREVDELEQAESR